MSVAVSTIDFSPHLPPESTTRHPLWRVFVLRPEIIIQINFITFLTVRSCSLPLFLIVTGSSRRPPLTPFEATSCGEMRQGVHSLKGPWAGNNTWMRISQTRVDPGYRRSLTTTWRGGGSLAGGVSVEILEVKSRLELTGFISGEPRSIGWSILVRLMVLWLLNGREGWSLSQSACSKCNGMKRNVCLNVKPWSWICVNANPNI